MSEIVVTSLSTNNITSNVITVANSMTVNSIGIQLDGGNGVINTTAIKIGSGSTNTVLTAVTSVPSINIGGYPYSSFPSETVNVQIFTANGTWTKPSWATTGDELVIAHLWGGGGGGGHSSDGGADGGGGGAFVFGYYKSSQCNATCNVAVGAGGTLAPAVGTVNTGGVGGTTIFWSNATASLNAYGGGGAAGAQGGGGGWFSAGGSNGADGGGPLGGNVTIIDSTFGGGTALGNSIYGGGGGAGASTGGTSIYGGAGGTRAGARAISTFGGAGGNNTVAPTTPGGGGGARDAAGAGGSAGARGEARIYTIRRQKLPGKIYSKITTYYGATNNHRFAGDTVYAAIVVFAATGNTQAYLQKTCTVNGVSATFQSAAKANPGTYPQQGITNFTISNPANGNIVVGNVTGILDTSLGVFVVEFDAIPNAVSSNTTQDNNSVFLSTDIIPSPVISVTNKTAVIHAMWCGAGNSDTLYFSGDNYSTIPGDRINKYTSYQKFGVGVSEYYTAGLSKDFWYMWQGGYTFRSAMALNFN